MLQVKFQQTSKSQCTLQYLKKKGAVECDRQRTISLNSHLTKVMLKVLMNRMRNKILPEISETQFGFITDKGTRNAIFSLRTLMERAID